ncbi:phospholipid-transporting ATPase IF-like isoform X2 [Branchiostoma floridae x Branchiostoma japonicum]
MKKRPNKGLEAIPPGESRTVYVANRQAPWAGTEVYIAPEEYPDNTITSSKYTAWNFIPKNLFEQFRRIANFYFLCVGIIQLSLGDDTPVSPVTSIMPLVFVVFVTAIKQGYEDWLRHKADNEVNKSPVHVIRQDELVEIMSQDIRVGDIVKVQSDESFPCDLVMLSSDDPEGNCHITTASLDGETNLKIHSSVPDTAHYNTIPELKGLYASIECQEPEPDLYRFVGRINIFKSPNEPVAVRTLGPLNILLRGARLKNTPYIYGVAVHTGQETKMALNSHTKLGKRSVIEKSMNTYLLFYLFVLLAETSLCTGLKYWYIGRVGEPWYVGEDPSKRPAFLEGLVDFLAFLVLFNYVIPISLYVTVEFQKFLGSIFISWDIEMYDEKNNLKAQANTSDLNEELGQIEYVFTDKTGTLTENEMCFRQCSIGGAQFEEYHGNLVHMSSRVPVSTANMEASVEEFLVAIALCHTVHVHSNNSSANSTPVKANGMSLDSAASFEYQASSPDEKALVEAADRFGITFLGQTRVTEGKSAGDFLKINVRGEEKQYELLHILEFDPTRKRMSAIIKLPNGNIRLYTKGAESALLPLCLSGERDKTLYHVNQFAEIGLRTLVYCIKELNEEQYADIKSKMTEARNALQDREEKVNAVITYIEKDFHLLGATGVEDKLQDGVSDTIQALRLAGVKVWVLTGDKQETAVNISHSCTHFQRGMSELYLVQQKTMQQCAETIMQHLKSISQSRYQHSTTVTGNTRRIQEDHVTTHALVVDGMSLAHILTDHRDMFMELCQNCTAVLCCRMSPLQKAEVVKLVKASPEHPVTLAIGDGANDCSMIQEAHVGVGIMGKEGRQAVRASDFAFARFQFLKKLLLVHGHYYYIRLATLVQYFFYKNVAFISPQLLFQFYNGYSQTTLYDTAFLTFYNIFFTSLPILLYGLFEQNIKKADLMKNPELYKDIAKNRRLDIFHFLYWTILGIWHALVNYYGPMYLFWDAPSLMPDQTMFGNFGLGTFIFTAVVIVVNLKMAVETHYWTWLNHFAIWGSIIVYFLFTLVYSAIMFGWPIDNKPMYYVFLQLLSSPTVWLALLVLVTACMIPDVFIKVIFKHIRPSRVQHKQMKMKNKLQQLKTSISTVSEQMLLSVQSSRAPSRATTPNIEGVRYVTRSETAELVTTL